MPVGKEENKNRASGQFTKRRLFSAKGILGNLISKILRCTYSLIDKIEDQMSE